MDKVSIITAYYNREDMTIEWLNNLTDKLYPECEVIVVNSGSKPIEHTIITKRIDLSTNHSFSHSMNAGIKEATGDYIIIIGNDTFPTHPNWIETLINYQKKTGAMIVCPENTRPGSRAYKHLHKQEDEYHMFPAICWLMPKETIEKVGLFDERFLIGCYEDNDYCRRVQSYEGKIVLCKNVLVDHKLSQTMNQFNVGQIMAKNLRRFKEKWGE